MAAALASDIVAGGLLRAAQAVGGNGVILLRGEASRGSLLVVLTSRGLPHVVLERILDGRGDYCWAPAAGRESPSLESVARFIGERKRFDPDIWALELDVPDVERFIADSLAET